MIIIAQLGSPAMECLVPAATMQQGLSGRARQAEDEGGTRRRSGFVFVASWGTVEKPF